MDMEVVGETMGSNSNDQLLLIVKGRRTKRQRPSSSFSVATSSGGSGDRSSSSPMNSVESTDEEEDMANCLILLAQGNNNHKNDQRKQQRIPDQKIQESGLYVYQCKTCERCFSSFQALGGHRASHKKPKTEQEDKKALVLFHEEEGEGHHNHQQSHIHQKAHNNKFKVHECSICGSEFSSGQALGGHMRRHRTTPPPSTVTTAMVNMNQHRFTSESPQEIKKSSTFLALDLNLPAPEEEVPTNNKYSFSSSLVFSASPMVDCHY